LAVNHKLLHRINQLEAEMTCVTDECEQGDRPCPTPTICCGADLRRVVTQPVSRDLGVEGALPSAFTNEPQPADDQPAPGLRWFAVVAVLAFLLAAIHALTKGVA
jgi:hypothetical protein